MPDPIKTTSYNTDIDFYFTQHLPSIKNSNTRFLHQKDTIKSYDEEENDKDFKKVKGQMHGEGPYPVPQIILESKPKLAKPASEIAAVEKLVSDHKIFRNGDAGQADVKIDGDTFRAFALQRESHIESSNNAYKQINFKQSYRKEVQKDIDALHDFAENRSKKVNVLGWIGKIAGASSVFLSVMTGVITFVTGGLGAFLGVLPAAAKGVEAATNLSSGIMRIKGKNEGAEMTLLKEKSDLAKTEVSNHLSDAQKGNTLFHQLWREAIQLKKKINTALESIKIS